MDPEPQAQPQLESGGAAPQADPSRPERAYTPRPDFAQPAPASSAARVVATFVAGATLFAATALLRLPLSKAPASDNAYAPTVTAGAPVLNPMQAPDPAVLAAAPAPPVAAPMTSSPLPIAGSEFQHETEVTEVSAGELDPSARPLSTDDMKPTAELKAPTIAQRFQTLHLSGTGPRLPESRPSGVRMLYAPEHAPTAAAAGQTVGAARFHMTAQLSAQLTTQVTGRAVPRSRQMASQVVYGAPGPVGVLGAGSGGGPAAQVRQVPVSRADNLFQGARLPDLNGQIVALDNLPAARNIIVYLAPWCPFCHKDAGTIKAMSAAMGAEGVPMRVIVGDDTDAHDRAFASQFGSGTLLDDDHKVGVHGFPEYMIVDPQGNVIKRSFGAFPSTADAIAWAH